MELGFALPTYANDGWRLPADRLTELAVRAENAGFGGLWVTEHLLVPPGRQYSRLDPLTTLATVAGATTTVPVGTCILIQPMRHPVAFAKRVATLHHLSGERLVLGLGIGWVEAEYNAVGVPFKERGPRFTEGLELLRWLFDDGEVTFDGDYYQVDNIRLDPPVRRPPKLLIGGGGVERDGEREVPEPIRHRIAEYGDGWLPSSHPIDVLEKDWADITAHVIDHDRDPAELDKIGLTWLHLVPGVDRDAAVAEQRVAYSAKDGPDRDTISRYLSGTVEDVHDQLAAYEDAGFDQVIIGPAVSDTNEVFTQFDRYITHLADYLS